MPVTEHPTTTGRRRARRLAPTVAFLALSLVLVACGDSKDDTAAPTTTQPPSPTTTAAESGGETVTVTAVDYAFEGVPKSAKAGTTLAFKNASAGEVHEVIVVRLKEGETRPVEELLALPPGEGEQLFAGEPGVAVALPGEDGMVVNGSLTLDQPGRYVMFCAIPTGADPQAYRDLFAAPPSDQQGPPDIPGGPPHFTMGMFAELTVE